TFICCGEGTFSTEGEPGDLKPNNTMIMRVDENANILWHKEFDAGWHECLYELALSDTGYICVGYKQDMTKDPEHYLWIAGDIAGDFTYSRTLDLGFGWQGLSGISKLPDEGFVTSGYAGSKTCIFMLYENGDTLKTNILGNGFPDQITINDIEIIGTGIVYGGIYIEDIPTDSTNAFVAQSDINLINQNFYVYPNENSYMQNNLRKLLYDDYTSFLALGIFQTYDRGSELWLKKYDDQFNLLWKRYIGGTEGETLQDAINTSDGGYLIIGESSSFDQYTSMYLVKIDSLGLGNYTSPVEEYIVNKDNELAVYPNPASNIVTIEFDNNNNTDYTIEIFDMSGRLVIQKVSCDYQNYLNIENLTNGLYMVRIIYENFSYQNKLIINH
ncbi:MAG: T9SS type A sorting domain-containing protein, partial [Bacteroidales bacterium]|nr:T9SS type A sorting domain-containing protein [Bacteroidales bacterium]